MNGSVPALWYVTGLYVNNFEVNFKGLTALIAEGNPGQAWQPNNKLKLVWVKL